MRSGQQDVAAAIAAHLGIGLYRLRGTDVPAAAGEQAALAALWAREAALLGCGLLVTTRKAMRTRRWRGWLRASMGW